MPKYYDYMVAGYFLYFKSYDFIYECFSDMNIITNALHEYRRITKIHRDEKTLWDLLRTSS